MNTIITTLLAVLLLLPLSLTYSSSLTITITNPTQDQRQELVEVDASLVRQKLGIAADAKFRVINALHQEVAYQLTYDGKLLIEASVRPQGTARFTIVPGEPRPMKTWVCGRQYPERVDDIAWENDRAAYRLYGPALQRNKERAFGNDVWVKNTPEADSLEELTTYHFDHGYGLDCYKVGPSLGCGAPALMDGNQIVFPYCYTDYQILDNWYEGATKPLDIASGVVIHNEDTTSVCLRGNMALYADPTDNPASQNFQIYVGVVFPYGQVERLRVPNEGAANGINGHALVVRRGVQPGERVTYYWGSAWSKNDCRNFMEWMLRASNLQHCQNNPLVVMVE